MMASSSGKPFNLDLFKCASHGGRSSSSSGSSGSNKVIIKHYLRNPIALQCGHIMCRECVEVEMMQRRLNDDDDNNENEKIIKCGTCNDENRIVEVTKLKESFILSELIDYHLNNLFKASQLQFANILNEANSKCKKQILFTTTLFKLIRNDMLFMQLGWKIKEI